MSYGADIPVRIGGKLSVKPSAETSWGSALRMHSNSASISGLSMLSLCLEYRSEVSQVSLVTAASQFRAQCELTCRIKRQQGGRAGRRTQESVAILVADVYAADQYFVKNPEILLTKPISDLVIDPDNAVILELHLQCAAFEMPLSSADEKYFGPTIMHILETRLVKDEEGWYDSHIEFPCNNSPRARYHTHGKYMPFPSKHVALRGAEEESYSLVDITGGESKVLEEMEHSRAIFEVFQMVID